MNARTRFDEKYYRRYYLDPITRALNPDALDSLTRFIFSYLDYLDIEIQTVTDIGCGLGHWRDALAKLVPYATYTGVEFSEHACEQYGWERGSVEDYTAEPQDLVICSDVLQYLDDMNASLAIANLDRLCTSALYFAVLTKDDWLHHCDQERTDGQAYLRTGDWYKKQLARYFWNVGGGLFVSKRAEAVLYELERL